MNDRTLKNMKNNSNNKRGRAEVNLWFKSTSLLKTFYGIKYTSESLHRNVNKSFNENFKYLIPILFNITSIPSL